MMTDEQIDDLADKYFTIDLRDGLRAFARAILEAAKAEPVGWMYEHTRSCVGPFTERKVIFTLDRWKWLSPGYTETPLYAAPQAQPPSAPDGWKLVPIEPTEAMVAAGWIDKEDVNPDDIYRAMLAAAPSEEKR